MSGGIEAAGDIATGMLIGRAVEHEAGEGSGGEHSGVCLNCGTALIGDFCHACGQNGHVHKTLTSIGHDLLHGVFHFEGKVWRTLPMLVTHPGGLTRRYIDGERARFVSPLAMFLFFVFLMFATLHSLEGGGETTVNTTIDPVKRAEKLKTIEPQIAAAQTERAQLSAKIDAARKAGQDVEALQDRRDSIDEKIDGLETARDTIGAFADGHGQVKLSSRKTGWSALDKGLAKANANPELALYKLQSSAYKYSWALIPISVPFVALLFLWRRKFKLYDHAIFVTYSLAFMMLLMTVVSLLAGIDTPGWIWGYLVAFGPPIHLFFQLRGAYRLNWFSALWRTFALLLFTSFTLTLFAMLLLGLGVMG